jgi:transcriptional regulator GlxA family with amidase domain
MLSDSHRFAPEKPKSLRVPRVQRALPETHESLVEVALGSGFADQSHFTRLTGNHRSPRRLAEHMD